MVCCVIPHCADSAYLDRPRRSRSSRRSRIVWTQIARCLMPDDTLKEYAKKGLTTYFTVVTYLSCLQNASALTRTRTERNPPPAGVARTSGNSTMATRSEEHTSEL